MMMDEKFDLNQISSNIVQHRSTLRTNGSNMFNDIGTVCSRLNIDCFIYYL